MTMSMRIIQCSHAAPLPLSSSVVVAAWIMVSLVLQNCGSFLMVASTYLKSSQWYAAQTTQR